MKFVCHAGINVVTSFFSSVVNQFVAWKLSWFVLVFKSKRSEMEWVVEHSGRSHLSDNSDSVIRMRGLPFECTKEDISNFFEGIPLLILCFLRVESDFS